jgi:hypothetical protein
VSQVILAQGAGAGVFKITRMGQSNDEKTTLLLKISSIVELIEAERNNYQKYVEDNWQETPKLLASETHFLLYEFGAHLHNFNPSPLRTGYAESDTDALRNLMKRLVESLRKIHKIGHDNVSFVQRRTSISHLMNSLRVPHLFQRKKLPSLFVFGSG